MCNAFKECHWGPSENTTCQAEQQEFMGGILPQNPSDGPTTTTPPTTTCRCMASSEILQHKCDGYTSVDVCLSNTNCHWGPDDNQQCQDENKAFWDNVMTNLTKLNKIDTSIRALSGRPSYRFL